jgi:beta-galactosidase/beta-glucuronidase
VEVQSPVRARRVLNGVWRFQSATENGQPGADWGHIRAPGSRTGRGSSPGIVQPGAGWSGDWRSADRAWYEYPVAIPSEWVGREIVLHLDRVSTDAEVFVGASKAGAVA